MKEYKFPILNNARKYLLPWLSIVLGPALSTLLPEKIIHSISMVLTQDQWLRVSTAFFVTLLVSFAYICYLLWQQRNKSDFKDYDFHPFDGYWKHKKLGIWLCASCKTDGHFSPLAFTDDWNMICPKCGKPTNNDFFSSMKRWGDLQPSTFNIEDYTKEKSV